MEEVALKICDKNEKKVFLPHFFTRGDPYDFFQFFYEILNEKSSKMTFLKKKFQGNLLKCLSYNCIETKI